MSIAFRLLLVTDPSIAGWLDATLTAIEIGRERLAVQVRGPTGGGELLHLARGLRAAAPDAILIVNDRCDVATLARANGVHLKESGIEVEEARALGLGLVGASCHDARGIARRAGADYLVLGPYGSVPGKGEPLGPRRFAELARSAAVPVLARSAAVPVLARSAAVPVLARSAAVPVLARSATVPVLARSATVPVLALGGIDGALAREAIHAGAHGVAVSRAILAARDPAAATRELLDALDRPTPQ